MRYMFERRVGMALVGTSSSATSGASSRAAGGAGAPAKEEKKEEPKTEPLTHAGGEIVRETGSPQEPAPSDDFQFDDPNPARVAGTRRHQLLDAESELEGEVSKNALTVRETASRRSRVEIDEDQAETWELGSETDVEEVGGQKVEKEVDSIKGSRMEHVLDYDRVAHKFSYKKDKDGKKISERDLTDHDVLGYARTAFGDRNFKDMSEEQQALFWQHIQDLGSDPLERLNHIERLRSSEADVGTDMYGRPQRRQPQGVLGDKHKHFDPTNPNNKENYFGRRLEEGDIPKEEREKALEAFRGSDKKDDLMRMSSREALRELEVDTSARSFPEQIEEAKDGLNPAGRQQTDEVTDALAAGRAGILERNRSPEVQEQKALAAELDDLRSEQESLDRHPELIERARGVFSKPGATGVPADKFDADLVAFSGLAAPKTAGDTNFVTVTDQYNLAVREGNIQEEERLWQELKEKVAGDKLGALETKRDFIKAKLAEWYSPERVAAHEKAVELEAEMRAAGVPTEIVNGFLNSSTVDADDIEKERKEYLKKGLPDSRAALDADIREKEKEYREMEDQTHYKHDLREQTKRERDYADYISAVHNAETDKATRLARRITGDRDAKITRHDYTDEGLKAADTRRREKRAGPADDAKTALGNVTDFLGKPGEFLGIASTFINNVNSGIGAINGIGETLNLKLTDAEATELRGSVKYDALFGENGVGRRGFKRADIVGTGPEGSNFAKYTKKEPAEGSAAKNLADLATPEKSGRARRQATETATAQEAKTLAEAYKTRVEGDVGLNKEEASAGKRRRYKVPTNYGGPGIPV